MESDPEMNMGGVDTRWYVVKSLAVWQAPKEVHRSLPPFLPASPVGTADAVIPGVAR